MFMVNIIQNIFNGPAKTESKSSLCEKQISEKQLNSTQLRKKNTRNGTQCVKVQANRSISLNPSSQYTEYCEKTMLVADSGHHHTKPTAYPIEIKTKKCSSLSLRSLSPCQSVIAIKKTDTIPALNHALKNLPPITSFFSKNTQQPTESSATNTSSSTSTSVSTLTPSFKPSTKFDSDDVSIVNTTLQQPASKAAALIIPKFRSPHSSSQQQQISSTSSVTVTKQQSNELLRRLTQPNIVPPTISHRIPNRDSASNDSLNLEMCYFKPIKPVPITPSKKGSPVIKRPLPKRIKPKRRKCDVYLAPKKGQIPNIFSTLTAHNRSSAFYSIHEAKKLKCSLPNSASETKQTNLLEHSYLKRKCCVILKRNNFKYFFNVRTKTKGNNRAQLVQSKQYKSTNSKFRASQTDGCIVKNLRMTNCRKSAAAARHYEILNSKKSLQPAVKGKASRLGLNEDDFADVQTKSVKSKQNKRSNNIASIDSIFPKRKVKSKGNSLNINNAVQETSDFYLENCKTNAKSEKTNNPKGRPRKNALRFNNINKADGAVPKTKAAVKQMTPGVNKKPAKTVQKNKRGNQKRRNSDAESIEFDESDSIHELRNQTKRSKINQDEFYEEVVMPQRTTRQSRQSSKAKDDLLKSDYEYALKLQMQLELEDYPIEPVANRTRRVRSRMNVTWDEYDRSLSMNSSVFQQYEKQNDSLNNNINSNSKNMNELCNNTESNMYTNEGQSSKSSSTVGKRIVRESNAKSNKRLYIPLKN